MASIAEQCGDAIEDLFDSLAEQGYDVYDITAAVHVATSISAGVRFKYPDRPAEVVNLQEVPK